MWERTDFQNLLVVTWKPAILTRFHKLYWPKTTENSSICCLLLGISYLPVTRYIDFQKLLKNSTTLITNIKNALGEKNMLEVKNKNCLDFNFYLALHKRWSFPLRLSLFFVQFGIWLESAILNLLWYSQQLITCQQQKY